MPSVKKNIHFVFLVAVVDILAITAGFYLAYHFRFFSGVIPQRGMHPLLTDYAKTLVVILPVYLWFFREYGLYQTHRHIRRIEEIFVVIKAVTFAVIILMAITFLYRGLSYSRVYLFSLWFFSILTISFSRYVLIQWEYRQRLQRKDISRLLLIGANRNARYIIQWAKNNPHYGQEIIGVLSRDAVLVGKHVDGVPIIGISHQAENFISNLKPDEVILLDPALSKERTADLIVTCEDLMINFKIGADFYGLMASNVDVEYISSVPLLGFKSLPLDDFWNRLVKRIFDLVVSSLLLLFSAPFWILAVIMIKLDDQGAVFYKQERVGRDEKVFSVLKFRTMRVNAERETGPVWARPNDRRRTRIGNFLRRWNIDELPQLLNVLRGDMSLVGPRPERPHFVKQFRASIPRYMVRHKIKSGLTGWAQVSGLRGNTSINERIKYDLYYMENWSLLFDIEILFMTFFAFKNAY